MVMDLIRAANARGFAAACVLAMASAGCSGHGPTPAETAVVSGSSGRTLPGGLAEAVLVLIDGQRVATGQRAVAVAPGPHRISVAPAIAGPVQQVPGPEYLVQHFPNQPLLLQAEAGRVYIVALRFTEPLNLGNRTGSWEAVLLESRGAAPASSQTSP
ncbi:MAG: hypothetical protein PVG91_01855 [Gammaproteobacteria bacterium]|jgi:hypothetical protein